jgi:perosamine synthetase
MKGVKMKIPQYEPCLDETEIAKLTECIRDNWITGGKKVKEFEHRIADLCRVKHAVACCNGTMGLFMGLKALDIGQGDEVIVPDFTFIASANAVVLAGAKPVFVDINYHTCQINPNRIENAITVNTKAIMPVHLYGQAANMSEIVKIAREYKISIIEDAAQGIGVTWCGQPVGGIGDVGMMSFYGDKSITSGEGGMVLTNNKEIYEKCLKLENQGNLSKGNYIAETIGYNFRMTDLQAAVGLAQLDKLGEIINRKRANELYYRLLLGKSVDFMLLDSQCFNVPFRVIIFTDNPEKMQIYLAQNEIETRRVFYPLHLQPCYNTGGNYPNSVKAYETGLALPSSVKLTKENIEFTCDKIKEYLG